MSFTATARLKEPGLRCEIDVNGRHTLVTDEPCELGGADSGPAPHELLPAAVAGCVSTMIEMYARRKAWDVGRVVTHVVYDPKAEPRHISVGIFVDEEMSCDQIERVLRIARTCPVRRALESEFSFTEELTVGMPNHEPAVSQGSVAGTDPG